MCVLYEFMVYAHLSVCLHTKRPEDGVQCPLTLLSPLWQTLSLHLKPGWWPASPNGSSCQSSHLPLAPTPLPGLELQTQAIVPTLSLGALELNSGLHVCTRCSNPLSHISSPSTVFVLSSYCTGNRRPQETMVISQRGIKLVTHASSSLGFLWGFSFWASENQRHLDGYKKALSTVRDGKELRASGREMKRVIFSKPLLPENKAPKDFNDTP